jgi:hypothetical protein
MTIEYLVIVIVACDISKLVSCFPGKVIPVRYYCIV